MSINRLALRLATVLALTNNNTAPYPTMAANRVYDSRLDPVEMFEGTDRRAFAVVYTDSDLGITNDTRGVTFSRKVDLIIELAIATPSVETVTSEAGPQSQVIIAALQTDATLEAAMDVFEAQVRAALFRPSVWGTQWHKMVRKVETWQSSRFAETDASRVRFTERRIALSVAPADDCLPAVVALATGETPPPAPGLPANIQALVDEIARAGTQSAYVAGVVAVLNSTPNPAAPLTLPMLEAIRFYDDLRQPDRTPPLAGPRTGGVAHTDFTDED